ncbi:MAG: hypothetical protein ABI175_12850, partial [Polyangiales bacterium]
MRLSWLALLVVAVLAPRTAAAYPQFQVALGSDRCSACHFSPAGGDLLTDFGRDEAGSTLSGRGDGKFLHGATELPSWLQLGADLRTAVLAKQLSERATELFVFPMQADTYTRIAAGPISLNLTIGLNGAARDRVAGASVLTYLASRAHYVMYESSGGSMTVR